MADCEPPSFSLGFDFGFESEPSIISPNKPAPDPPALDPSDRTPRDNDDKSFGPEAADSGSDPETGPNPPRVLRRGPPRLREMPPPSCNGEEEIEEFSSQEDILQGIICK